MGVSRSPLASPCALASLCAERQPVATVRANEYHPRLPLLLRHDRGLCRDLSIACQAEVFGRRTTLWGIYRLCAWHLHRVRRLHSYAHPACHRWVLANGRVAQRSRSRSHRRKANHRFLKPHAQETLYSSSRQGSSAVPVTHSHKSPSARPWPAMEVIRRLASLISSS